MDSIGWSDFEEKKCYTLLEPNSKISCLNVASFLGRRALENFGL